MDSKRAHDKEKKKIQNVIVDMIDEGSDKVTTISESAEAKYESIGTEEPGKEPQTILKNYP